MVVSILIMLAIGAVAGFIAGNLMKGGGFGLIGNIVVGIVGSFIGTFIGGLVGLSFGNELVSTLIWSVIGACVLLFVIGLVKKAM